MDEARSNAKLLLTKTTIGYTEHLPYTKSRPAVKLDGEKSMHLVTKSYFEEFCTKFAPPYDAPKNFECFANYCVFSQFSSDAIEPSELVYEDADPGIDGAFVFVEDRAVFSLEELNKLLSETKRDLVFFSSIHSSKKFSKLAEKRS